MTTVQIIQGAFEIADPSWPVLKPWASGRVYASDGFSTPGELVGAHTDAMVGGLPMRWAGRTGGWMKESGSLRWVATGEALIEMGGPSYELSVDVVALPTAGQIYIVGRRQSANPVENNHYRLDVTAAGALYLRKSVEGPPVETITLGQSSVSVVAGDTVTLRVAGSSISAQINGVTQISATDATYQSGGWAGLQSTTSAPGVMLDNFKLIAL